MKKLLTSLLLLSIVLSLSGCWLKNEADELVDDVKDSYENVKDKTGEIIEDVQEKKEKAEETIDNLKGAYEKVEAAASALSELTD